MNDQIKQSLVSYVRSNMDNMKVADRKIIETDQGPIVQYEIWLMESSHVLRMFIEVVEDETTPYNVPSNDLPMQKLLDLLNAQ